MSPGCVGRAVEGDTVGADGEKLGIAVGLPVDGLADGIWVGSPTEGEAVGALRV